MSSSTSRNDRTGDEELAFQILQFPAFSEAKRMNKPLKEIFQIVIDAYEQEQLTEEQDLILECLLYLHSLTEDFDLRRALLVWEEGDLNQFFTLSRNFHHQNKA